MSGAPSLRGVTPTQRRLLRLLAGGPERFVDYFGGCVHRGKEIGYADTERFREETVRALVRMGLVYREKGRASGTLYFAACRITDAGREEAARDA